ncbi:uncharacterized protein LOC143255703 isoform X2 [Tachypleus tridentatus]|uniref:uncharacterized protein LOC143255703 isoform X2 n=1 Tax=Tachypleus tridentatus TaxID=6853 RepID=UPI003FCF1C6B
MAYKSREEIVGKRFLSVCTTGKLKLSKLCDWEWRAGTVRAASHKDTRHRDLAVLVEFDDVEWEHREWVKLHDGNAFRVFLLEETLVWSLREEIPLAGGAKNLYWPAISYQSLVDKAGVLKYKYKPIEYLVDKGLDFVDYSKLKDYQPKDWDTLQASRNYPEVRKAIRQWTEFQDGQRILLTTPSVLVGYRVQVYRTEGTTQWYTAVIVSYNNNSQELTLTDDTVLEEHSEDPCLVQIKLIGEGIVESILKGENVGITPRRRACTQNNQHNTGHYTRTRSQVGCSVSNSRFTTAAISKKPRPLASIEKVSCGKQEESVVTSVEQSQKSTCIAVTEEQKRKTRFFVTPAETKQKSGFIVRAQDQRQKQGHILEAAEHEQVTNSFVAVEEQKQKSKFLGKEEPKQKEWFSVVPEEHKRKKTSTKSCQSVVNQTVKKSFRNHVVRRKEIKCENKSKLSSLIKPSNNDTFTIKEKTQEQARICELSKRKRKLVECKEPVIRIQRNSFVVQDSRTRSQGRASEHKTLESNRLCSKVKTEKEKEAKVVGNKNIKTKSKFTVVAARQNDSSISTVVDVVKSLPVVLSPSCKSYLAEKPSSVSVTCSKTQTLDSVVQATTFGISTSSVVVSSDHGNSSQVQGVANHFPTPEMSTLEVQKTFVEACTTDSSPKHDISISMINNKTESINVNKDSNQVKNTISNIPHVDYNYIQRVMHPAGIVHTAVSATGPYTQLSNVTESIRMSSARLPPTQLGTYGITSPRVFPTHPVPGLASSSHMDQHTLHSQVYRQMLPQHTMLPPQYGTPVGVDVLWTQKYPHLSSLPNSWALAQAHYQEELRVMAQERDRQSRVESEREEQYRLERMKIEKEKSEKGRRENQEKRQQERERRDQEKQEKEYQERERVKRVYADRERQENEHERERAAREVQQHFEESLRLANQKKHAGWSPIVNLPLTKSSVVDRDSPVIVRPDQGVFKLKREKIKEQMDTEVNEKHGTLGTQVRQDSDCWLMPMQYQNHAAEQHIQYNKKHSFIYPQQQASSSRVNQECYSPKQNRPSPGPAQSKTEPSFSLYGYQPFQHMYITPAQLKAREESKNIIAPIQSVGTSSEVLLEKDYTVIGGPSHTGTPSNSRSNSSEIRPLALSPKQSLKLVQEYSSSPQMVAGGDGVFKPYDYSVSSPAPAHQNTSSPKKMVTSQYSLQLQDQPQNLVKQEYQKHQLKHGALTLQSSSPSETFSGGYSISHISAKGNVSLSATTFSNSLIQAGLVPNPIYTSTVGSVSTTTATQTIVDGVPSSVLVHPYMHQTSNISKHPDTSLCKTSSVLNLESHSQVASCTCETQPVDRTSSTSPLTKKSSIPTVMTRQSPSPMLLSSTKLQTVPVYNLPITSPTNEPIPSVSNTSLAQIQPLNLQSTPVLASTKRRLAKEDTCSKRTKNKEDLVSHPNIETVRTEDITSASMVSTVPTFVTCTMVVTQQNSSFMDSFCSFVSSSQLSTQESFHCYSKHAKVRHKSKATAANSKDISEIPLSISSASTGQGQTLDSDTEVRITPSPALSTYTNYSSSSGSSNTNHTKLKKAWLQRHSENEDKTNIDNAESLVKNPGVAVVKVEDMDLNSPKVSTASSACNSTVNSKSSEKNSSNKELSKTKTKNNPAAQEEDSTSSASETEREIKRGKTPRKRTSKTQEKGSSHKKIKQRENSIERNSEDGDTKIQKEESNLIITETVKGPAKQGKRGRRPKARGNDSDTPRKKKALKPFETPSIARLKRTGEPFLQNGPCCEVAPKLSKCRECRMTPHQRNKKMPNIFCRFYAFRKLRYGKNGAVLSAGFSEPSDASEEDCRLWIPTTDSPPDDLDLDTAKFLLTHVGDQFCDLVNQEREAKSVHMSENKIITWKQVVQGVREMCDVCETTLFNIHWVCHKCGFVVCIDCYKARKYGTVKEEECPPKDRDEYQWLLCNNRLPHEQDKLMLTQIIADTALWDVGKKLHELRVRWNINAYCKCHQNSKEKNTEGKKSTNGICKQLMSAVTKCFTERETGPMNGLAGQTRATRKSCKVNGVSNLINKEEALCGYSSESGGSPLSWLADVALNSSGKMLDRGKNERFMKGNESSSALVERTCDEIPGSDDERNDSFSTLRELLIRPSVKNGNGGSSNSNVINNQRKTLTSSLEEVISCVIEHGVGRLDKTVKEEKQLKYFVRRYPKVERGVGLLPIRVFTLAESILLYPNVPHSWLCNGKLLVLHDSQHNKNLSIFQEQWKRGQPVMVINVTSKLDMNLWHPESFIRDFGDVKNDLVNCRTGAILPNLPMKKFWDGFESFSKRMKDDNGDYMLLKLKDWPPGEDFSELLPSRFQDLMNVLPLPEYTHRNGLLNLAGRLPECFVRPDLGPKMYNAYGSAVYSKKGTTNLHLDVSDAVNVMVYVGIPRDGKNDDYIEEAFKAIEDGGCEVLTQKRVREKGMKPGALWHIYNARDADKIRDLLNKVALEHGEKPEAHHDPIHDQSWYLNEELRERLYKEYGVEGYAIVQCLGDAVFIPAGAPHQVRNLHSCIKVAEDFVSPENIAHCFTLTQEFRDLTDTHTNHEDKLQIKNIIYHTVKDALSLLEGKEPDKKK